MKNFWISKKSITLPRVCSKRVKISTKDKNQYAFR